MSTVQHNKIRDVVNSIVQFLTGEKGRIGLLHCSPWRKIIVGPLTDAEPRKSVKSLSRLVKEGSGMRNIQNIHVDWYSFEKT